MLAELIDDSYRLFSRYRATSPLDICTYCCMKPEDEARLASLPVKEIPRDLLSEYNDGARSGKTPIEELKHFLPRYFELISQFDFPSHSTELSLSRVMMPFDKSEWTTEELDLLTQFSESFFKHCLSIYPLPSGDRINAILIMFSASGFYLSDLLKIWEKEKTLESALHFRDLYFRSFDQYQHTKLSNAFGEKDQALVIRDWLNNENVRREFIDTIEQIILGKNEIETEDADELSLLYDILRTKVHGN